MPDSDGHPALPLENDLSSRAAAVGSIADDVAAVAAAVVFGRTGMSPAAVSAALFLLADVSDCLWRKGRPNRRRSKPGGAGRAESSSAWADILSAWRTETRAVFCCLSSSSENAPDESSELERKRVRHVVVCSLVALIGG